MLLAVCAPGMHAQSAQVGAKQAETLNLSAYAELLRSDVRASKVAILTELMGLTESEDKAFWPLYREVPTANWRSSETSAWRSSRNTRNDTRS